MSNKNRLSVRKFILNRNYLFRGFFIIFNIFLLIGLLKFYNSINNFLNPVSVIIDTKVDCKCPVKVYQLTMRDNIYLLRKTKTRWMTQNSLFKKIIISIPRNKMICINNIHINVDKSDIIYNRQAILKKWKKVNIDFSKFNIDDDNDLVLESSSAIWLTDPFILNLFRIINFKKDNIIIEVSLLKKIAVIFFLIFLYFISLLLYLIRKSIYLGFKKLYNFIICFDNIKTYMIVYIIIIIRIVFQITYAPFISYSLNITGDSITYLNMMLQGESNLCHASGYPFLLGLISTFPMKHFIGTILVKSFPNVINYFIVFIQHLISIIIMVYLFRFLLKKANKFIAYGFSILYGLHYIVVSSISVFYPEWLQANLLILFIITLYYAFFEKNNFKKKVFYYAVASFIFAFGYLVKYNFLFFSVFFFVVLIIDLYKLKKKELFGLLKYLWLFIICILVYNSVIWSYKIFYHRSSTGTYDLNYDHAWILLHKASFFQGILDKDNGINTKRLLLLNTLLPKDNKNYWAWNNIKDVSPDIEYYKKRYSHLLRADNRSIDQYISQNNIKLKNSTHIHSIVYYLGMKEADKLGTHVFIEKILKYPGEYIKHIMALTANNLINFKYLLIFPLKINKHGFAYFKNGFYIHKLDPDIYHNKYFKYKFYVWKPGIYLFDFLVKAFNFFPTIVITFFCVLGFILSIVKSILSRNINFNNFIIMSFSFLTILYIIFSNSIYFFRPEKEFILIYPIISLLISFNLYQISISIKSLFNKIK